MRERDVVRVRDAKNRMFIETMDTFSVRDMTSRTYSSVAFYRTAISPRDRFRVSSSEPT